MTGRAAYRLSALLLAWGTAATLASAQSTVPEHYRITRWGMEQGLPQSSVNDILLAQDGYIWLATFGGLVRFDGVTFTTFDRSNSPGLMSDRILNLFETRDGSIWIGTEGGLHRFSQGRFTAFPIIQNSFVYSPNQFKEDASGRIWIVVNGLVYRQEGDRFESVPIRSDSASVASATADRFGSWFVDDTSVLKTHGNEAVRMFSLRDRIREKLMDVIEHPAGSGRLLVATSEDGVIRYQNGVIRALGKRDGLHSPYNRRFNRDAAGRLWVVGFDGFSLWDGDRFQRFTAIPHAPEVMINNALSDPEGNVWVGASGDGLYRARPARIEMIGDGQGLDFKLMLSLTTLNDGSHLFATNCGGVYQHVDGRSSKPPINRYFPNLCIWSVFQDSEGWIWYGSKSLHRSRSLNGPLQHMSAELGFDGVDVFAMTQSRDGRVWIGALNGVYVWDGIAFKRLSTADGLSYNDTRVLFEDRDGVMWAGTTAGLNRIRNNVIETIGMGLPDGASPYVRAIHQDADGTMWFGTYGNGLFRYRNGRFFNITREHGLYDNIVSHVVDDGDGHFWMGSNRGVFRADRAELNDLADGRRKQIASIAYGVEDGLRNTETNGGFQPHHILDGEGRLHLPTVAGIAVIPTRELTNDPVPPRIRIEQVRVGSEHVDHTQPVRLTHDSAYLDIRYTALSFGKPEKSRFRYRLEGLDDRWIEAEGERRALFTKLPPGEYVFRVVGSNGEGVWNMEGATLMITVTPPLWRQPWFIAILVWAGVASLVALIHMRLQRLHEANETKRRFTDQLLTSQEAERRRIASDLHDGLGQQILVIKNRAELAKQLIRSPESATEQLDEVIASAVNAIEDVRSITHDLRPVHLERFGLTDALTNLCEEVRRTAAIDLSYHVDVVDDSLRPDDEIHFYRVVQEGITNILKHSKAEHASIIIRKEEKQIRATFEDDGVGFDPQGKRDSAGLGLLGILERIESLGGSIDVRSTLGNGTLLTITIPVLATHV